MDDPRKSRDWRYRLRGDPGRWLLEQGDNPSVYFWFQRDIVGRPEDAPSLVQAREDILYSPPVQALFAAQDALGYWESPGSLDAPRYRATAWSLAVLAELGVARASRRAHSACEFVLQSIADDAATMARLDRAAAGLLARALVYFMPGDPRLGALLDQLVDAAAAGNLMALWTLAEAGDAARYGMALEEGSAVVLNRLAANQLPVVNAFPPFDVQDAVLALRVLTFLDRAADERAASTVERLWEQQQEGARWALGRSFESVLGPAPTGVPNKWATLNALRILTKQPKTAA